VIKANFFFTKEIEGFLFYFILLFITEALRALHYLQPHILCTLKKSKKINQ